MTHEPVRLLHDPALSAALRRDLGAAVHVDSGYDVSAGLARFEGNLAAGAGVTKAAGLSGGAVVGAALLLAGGLAAALLLGTQPPAPPPSPAAVIAVAAPIAAPAPVQPAPQIAPTPAPADEILLDDDPTTPPPVARKRPAAAKSSKPSDKPDGSADYLREARNLQAARSLLGTDAARALALAEAGAAEFRGGTFAQEWQAIAILALFELGRPESRARGEAFLRTYPSGTYAPRIRQALEN